jgi:hypothetical protein
VTAPRPRELVVLVDEEFVGERGNVKVVWLVAHNDGFIPARQSVGARNERLDAGPGVVWRSRIEIELARGAPVVRVETRPGARRGSTLEHLTGGAKSGRSRTVRKRFVVGPRGELTPEARSPRTK